MPRGASRGRVHDHESHHLRNVGRRRIAVVFREVVAIAEVVIAHHGEFYEVTDAEPELAALQLELRAWETVYNTIRPHQSLGYLTPAEYLASVGIDVYRTY
jgi:hypothetical protein